MRIRLHVVIDQEKESFESEVKELLNQMCSDISFSPSREQPSLKNCWEFYATAKVQEEEIQLLLDNLNNDWEQDGDDYEAYGFNTQMFHPHVYYLHLQIL